MAGTASFDREHGFKEALRTAVAHGWAELPEAVQDEQLAPYLHDHHPHAAYKR